MNDQAKKLREKLRRSARNDVGKTVSVISGKGGVGKSNFAVNLSLELIRKGKKVLLLDLDVGMGNIDILLGLHSKHTVVDMIEKKISIFDIIEMGPNDLSYISGGSGLTSFFTMNEEKRQYFYEQYDQLTLNYDYIIFDMGAGVTSESIFFILSSDECIVITTPEPTSITDAYGMIKHIVNHQANMPMYVVINRCLSSKMGKRTLERFQSVVSNFLHIELRPLGYLPEDRVVSQAVMKQTPYILASEGSSISKALRKIASNYLMDTDEADNKHSFSFIKKLKKFIGKGQ